MEQKKYDYILFDFDGTIADTSEGIFDSFDYVKKTLGGRDIPRSEYDKMIGPPLAFSFREFFGFGEDEIERAIRTYRVEYERAGLFKCKMYEGMKDVFSSLQKAGKSLFVATSKPEVYARKLMAHFGVSHFFSYIGGSDISEKRAKKSEVIEYVLSSSGVKDKSRAVIVGDRLHDAQGAKEAGIDCIGVLFGFGSEAELKNAGVEKIAQTPADILKILL